MATGMGSSLQGGTTYAEDHGQDRNTRSGRNRNGDEWMGG